MRFRVLFFVPVLVAGSALAAETSFESHGTTYFLALSDPAAVCRIETGNDSEVREARCSAGAYFVTATPGDGCGDSFGPAYCASVDPGGRPPIANELRCANGRAYVLTGGRGEVRCTRDGDAKRCASADDSDVAEATCAGGCGTTRGAGACCVVGSEGCPPAPTQPASE